MKSCTKCGVEQELSEFYKHPNTKDKLNPACKECFKVNYQENREKRDEQTRNWHKANPKKNSTYTSRSLNKTGPLYRTWRSMRDRCTNPNITGYEYYGGRGISVCERWDKSYKAFETDMGPKPDPSYSIDRIDPNGNYEPSNCRWADAKTQRLNQRKVT